MAQEQPVQPPLRILVVEDEPSYRILYNKILGGAGFLVVSCKAGDEAIDALVYGNFDLIILDHKIPGPSGLNVLQWMYGRKMDVPVIIITGKGSEELELEANKFGVDLYLTKTGFDPLTLPETVARIHTEHLLRNAR
jgi:DNA-binding response OmpR family regulator